jgi:glycosyltransferase involved in cell wall biosynthesis
VRVLFYYSSPDWTGSARAFVAAGRGLAARGAQVTFVCPGGGPVEARAAADGCDVVALEPAGALLLRSWRLQRILSQRFIETVFVHSEEEQLAVAMAMRLAGRGGVVRRISAGTQPALGRRTRWALRLAATGFVCTDAADTLALEKLTRARTPIVADIGVDPERYDELRGVTLAALGASPTARLIVCIYEASQKARIAGVLRTIALLAPRHPDLYLAILGPPSGNEDVRMHAAALGITRQISYLGERDDDLAVLRAAEVGWVVASSDTAGYAALDFMAMRTPVLADRDSIAARYIADGITGALLTPGETPASAATVAALLSQEGQRSAMGSAGRARVVREYKESRMVDLLGQAADVARDRSGWKA